MRMGLSSRELASGLWGSTTLIHSGCVLPSTAHSFFQLIQ
jgi:hypothetical protein